MKNNVRVYPIFKVCIERVDGVPEEAAQKAMDRVEEVFSVHGHRFSVAGIDVSFTREFANASVDVLDEGGERVRTVEVPV